MGNILIKKNKKIIAAFLIFGIAIFLFPQSTHAMDPIYAVLKNTGSGEGKTVLQVWNSLINIANTFVIVLLIAIAFAQILRINVNTYGVKKILPTLIFAIIAANFSFLFCRLMIDIANALLSIFFEGVGSATSATLNSTGGVNSFKNAFTVSIGSASDITGGKIFWFIIGQLLKLAAGVIVLILAFLFLVRNWMIYFLVALAPFCMMAMVLPQTKSIFTQWWSNFMKWVFMPIVSVFWLWVGAQWFNAGFSAGVWLINYVFAGVCAYLALTTPFKMGGAIMNQWSGIGKQLWGRTGAQAIKGGKWFAGGGFASMMAYRNQQAANRIGLTDKQRDQYKNKAEEWTKFNLGARVAGYKGRFAAQKSAYEKAPMKTNYYNSLLGPGASVQAGYDANIDDDRNASAAANGAKVRSMLDKVLAKDPNLIKQFDAEAHDAANAGEAKALGFVDSAGNIDYKNYARHRMTDYIRSKNSNVLAQNFRGTLSPFQIGELKSASTAFIQSFKGRGKQDAFTTAYGVSAVGVGPVPVAAATQVIQQNMPGGGQTLVKEAMYGAGEFKELENIPEGEGFMNVKLIGVSEQGKNHLQSAFDSIRGAREAAVQNLMNQGRPDIEQELTGVGMIIASGRRGSNRRTLQANLNLARELLGKGQIDQFENATKDSFESETKEYFDPKAFSLIAGASKSISGANKEQKTMALQKRIDNLQAGLDHFKQLATLSTDEQRGAIDLMQKDPTGQEYIKQTKQRLEQQNEIKARSAVNSGMAVENMANNPNLQNATLATVGNSDHPHHEQALSEIAQSLEGLSHQMQGLTSGPLSDPHALSPGSVGDKAEFMNMAKEVMRSAQQGAFATGASATSKLDDANIRRLFADQIGKAAAQALTKSLGKTSLKVNVVSKPATPVANQQPAPPPPPPPQQTQTPPAQE